jgi:glyoxylase-like metal-dependent hydrolase (beta-lactamase superfamily II)
MKVWAFSAGGIDASARLMTGRGSFVGGYAISLTCLLVARPEGLVLVDTGWGSPTVVDPRRFPGTLFALTAGAPHAPRGETALGRVRSLGMRAEDVTDVVLTHLDIDHVGGLADFPHARVHVSRAEHAARFERRQPFRSRIHDSRPAFAHGPRFSTAAWTDHAELGFQRSADLFGDGSIMLLEASGHTPGHAAVLVCAGEQLLLHAGDAFVHHAELDGEDDLPLGVRLYRRVLHEDKPSAQATLSHLRALRRERVDVTIVNAHDATLLGRLPTFPATVAG